MITDIKLKNVIEDGKMMSSAIAHCYAVAVAAVAVITAALFIINYKH